MTLRELYDIIISKGGMDDDTIIISDKHAVSCDFDIVCDDELIQLKTRIPFA